MAISRKCKERNCKTILSVYNKNKYCYNCIEYRYLERELKEYKKKMQKKERLYGKKGASIFTEWSKVMGDTGDDFKLFNEIKAEERARKEPGRFDYAQKELIKLGCDIRTVGGILVIEVGCGRIDFWPYSGWFCGRKPLLGKVKGRGIKNLLEEIRKVCGKAKA